MKSPVPSHAIALLASAVALLVPSAVSAQSPSTEGAGETVPSWEDLGFEGLPEGFPTDGIALIAGLNKSRGSWSFEGSAATADAATPIGGTLRIAGEPQSGMVPMWNLSLEWPVEEPEHTVVYNLLTGPEADGLKLMLVRLGPMELGGEAEAEKVIFHGTWDLGSRTITWTEAARRSLPSRPGGETAEKPGSTESFAMGVAADGAITIGTPERAADRPRVSGKTVARVGQPYVEEKLAPKDSTYAGYADVTDPRVRPCLPPGATDIELRSERGGHFARYTVDAEDFHQFLDGLWEANKDSSAHRREEMHGEGEPAKQEGMAQRFGPLGWKPLGNAVRYYSPSKASGAMTTYYFDREAGVAYHDRGYW